VTYAPPLRHAVRELDPELPVALVRTMSSFAALSGLLGVLGFLLSVVGIYGVMSYTVQQRRHEIGVRLALGARAGDVTAMVVRRGASLAAIGIAIGTAGALVLTRLMTKLLFGVTPNDGATFVDPFAVLRGD
jgi:putative ABC transport system permease protein